MIQLKNPLHLLSKSDIVVLFGSIKHIYVLLHE